MGVDPEGAVRDWKRKAVIDPAVELGKGVPPCIVEVGERPPRKAFLMIDTAERLAEIVVFAGQAIVPVERNGGDDETSKEAVQAAVGMAMALAMEAAGLPLSSPSAIPLARRGKSGIADDDCAPSRPNTSGLDAGP